MNQNKIPEVIYICDDCLFQIGDYEMDFTDMEVSISPYNETVDSSAYILKQKYDNIDLAYDLMKEQFEAIVEEQKSEIQTLKDRIKELEGEKEQRAGYIKTISISSDQIREFDAENVNKWHDLLNNPTHIMILDKDGNKEIVAIKPNEDSITNQ